nr:L-rhamnose mutarotase [Paraburkholderia nodosa]
MATAAQNDAVVQRWETLMWQFQTPTPWTPSGQKWVAMSRIFDLEQQ